jgi:putative two-component system response regulator
MKKRILVVDDEPEFTSLLKLSLESHGYYEVREENDAESVRAAAREFDPDLVVLDIMMPKLEGNEVAASLRADPMTRDVPILFLTALVSQEDAPLGACSSGGNTFLPKDIRLDKLMRCIEDKIDRRQAAAVAAR